MRGFDDVRGAGQVYDIANSLTYSYRYARET
jgi:hypothetical protein